MNELAYSASGKLLLFGEYLVLRGANCFAIPLSFKQDLRIAPITDNKLIWEAFDGGKIWLRIEFDSELNILSTNDENKAVPIQKLLQLIRIKRRYLKLTRLHVQFTINFSRQFGFGTSSTLISLMSQWTYLDPYYLLLQSFGGSGFDVAAATADGPFTYSIEKRFISKHTIAPQIRANLLFVYIGQKQKSVTEVNSFKNKEVTPKQLEQMNYIVQQATTCLSIEKWEMLMDESETLLSSILHQSKVKDKLFDDYPFSIKSLGAWGGDFIMATCRDIDEAKSYFENKGLYIYYTYDEIIKR